MAWTAGHEIVLYSSGRRHSGENLERLLASRGEGLDPPLLMCDASSSNTSPAFEAIVANCLAHARGKFVAIESSFPVECRFVLESLGQVYHNDDETSWMSPEARLEYHKQHSRPVMDRLRERMQSDLDERRVEPNASLADAYNYMLKRWDKLTRFLEIPGADLDNNAVERALKMTVLHRKNALFFKTENGAWVADVLMSLIQTAIRCGADPYDYLATLKRNAAAVRREPAEWLPWSYPRGLGSWPIARQVSETLAREGSPL
jgi:hypothetical protein